jgi:ribonuclease BN (tRNA processing enzyme)
MRIVFLGTGAGLPNPQRAPSGLLIQVDGADLLFDSGSGTMDRLLAAGVEPTALDYLYYTHTHSDHTADLIPLLQAMALARRPRDLHLTAPEGFDVFLDGLLALQPWARPHGYRLVRHAAESAPCCGPEWTVTAARTGHTPTSVAYRVTAGGKSVVYSGDAVYTPALVELGRGADLLILECSFPDDFPDGERMQGHLTPALAGRIARETAARHTVLTHFYPVCRADEIEVQMRRAFDGLFTLAYDGLVMGV